MVQAMVGKRSGVVIQQLLHKMFVDLVRDEVKAMAALREIGALPMEATVQFVAGGLFGLLMWWSKGRLRLPAEEVNALFLRIAIPSVRAALG
jgi:hypothetical protein